jgi:hypothetical protein
VDSVNCVIAFEVIDREGEVRPWNTRERRENKKQYESQHTESKEGEKERGMKWRKIITVEKNKRRKKYSGLGAKYSSESQICRALTQNSLS